VLQLKHKQQKFRKRENLMRNGKSGRTLKGREDSKRRRRRDGKNKQNKR